MCEKLVTQLFSISNSINMISSIFKTKARYTLYGVIASASIISISAQAAGLDGVFGDYFTNMTTSCGANEAITGFNTAPATYGMRICTTFQSIVGSVLGTGIAPTGSAVVGFAPITGAAIFAPVSDNIWQKSGGNISYSGWNVGIGTTTPGAKLEVNGQVKITGGTPGLDKVLTSDATGLASWTSKNQVCPGNQPSNICYGDGALFSNNTGYGNTAIGENSLLNNTQGVGNTANGRSSLFNNTTGYANTAYGVNSLYSNTTGSFNTANGSFSLVRNTTGDMNTANGFYSLEQNTTGISNTANGFYSLNFNTTGESNTANGSYSLFFNTIGKSNTAYGFYSLFYNTTGFANTALGGSAASRITTGSNNIAIGYDS
ncbi:hypothetical protein H7169_02005, partial [Candidatus Gracilibacteria bacterium]|nr:hypothetical protein [Candidatus Gracilibacteria bacterium]